ncbi:MAG: DUF935 family protein [Elusimicrobiales bacterium]
MKPKNKTPQPLRRLAASAPASRPSFTAGEIATRERGMWFSLNGMPLPNPDVVLKRMGKDITAYADLLADAHVGGCVESRKSGVLSLDWAVNRGKAANPAAELVQDAFSRLDMRRVISELLDAPLFGYNISEIIWDSSSGRALPADVRQKPPEWFCFGEQADLRFKSIDDPVRGEPLPPRKFLKTVHNGGWRNPYGFPVLSKVFWPATFKKGGLKFWALFCEKYGMPHIVAKVPRGKVSEESGELLATLEQMVQDAIAVIPDDASVEIQHYDGTGSSEIYERFLNYCKAEISIGLLGQTLTTEVGDKGSYAAAQTHMAVRKDIVDTDKNLVESALNQLAQWIVDLNMPGAEAPKLGLYAQEDVDVQLAQRDETLTRQGVRFKKSYYQREYGLQDADFDIAEPQSGGLTPFAGKAAAPPAPDAADELAAALDPAELQKQAGGLLKPVFDLVAQSASHDELLEKLAGIYPDMSTAALEDKLTHVIFIADLLAMAEREQPQ